MAQHLSLDQKRLESLRRQLYGKDAEQKKRKAVSSTASPKPTGYQFDSKVSQEILEKQDKSISQESSFLKRDLLKITFVSTAAVLVQVLLFVGLQMNLIRF